MAPPGRPRPRPHPGRGGYWTGAGILAVGVLVGAILIAVGFLRVVALPDFTAEFSEAETTRVDLDHLDEGTWRIYIDRSVNHTEIECGLAGPDPEASVENSGFDHSNDLGSGYWELAKDIDVAEPGDYEITCTSGADLGYAVGQDSRPMSKLGLIVVGAVVGTAGLVLGAVTIIVTAVRRSRSTRSGPPPPGPHAPRW